MGSRGRPNAPGVTPITFLIKVFQFLLGKDSSVNPPPAQHRQKSIVQEVEQDPFEPTPPRGGHDALPVRFRLGAFFLELHTYPPFYFRIMVSSAFSLFAIKISEFEIRQSHLPVSKVGLCPLAGDTAIADD